MVHPRTLIFASTFVATRPIHADTSPPLARVPSNGDRPIFREGDPGIGERGERALESTAGTPRVDLSRLQGRWTTRQPRRLRTCGLSLVDKWSRCHLVIPMREHTLHGRQERLREHGVPRVSSISFYAVKLPEIVLRVKK